MPIVEPPNGDVNDPDVFALLQVARPPQPETMAQSAS